MMQFILKNLTLPVPPDSREMTSFWNPLCAGTFLSYITYYVNVEGGCAMIDSVAQARIVLHLYNAAKQRGLLMSDGIHILDQLDQMLDSNLGIWAGSRPTQGNFAKQFLISFGFTAAAAREFIRDTSGSGQVAIVNRARNRPNGHLHEIKPEVVSKAFRQIVLGDFSLAEDKYHTNEQRQRMKDTPVYKFAVRMNDTLDTIEKEQVHRSINLIVCSGMLNQFVYSMANILKWRPLIDDLYQRMDNHANNRVLLTSGRLVDSRSWQNSHENFTVFSTALLFAIRVLGPMDQISGPIPESSEAIGASMWIDQFFPRMPPSNLIYFMPTQVDSDDKEDERRHLDLYYM
jgi:hypothetical protein